MNKSRLLLLAILGIGIACFIIPAVPSCPLNAVMNWAILATLVVVLGIAAFLFQFEATAISSKEIALVAMLGAVSAVLRVPFAALPSVQPCTYLVVCSGYVFGPVAGFMVGAITALVSNFFLGQGPWTLYQMLAWGLVGVSAAYLRRFKLNTPWLVILGVVWGYAFGWLVNTWFWAAFIYPHTLKTFMLTQLSSLWLDTFHAAGNAVFLGLLGARTIAILERFKKRFTWAYG